MYSFSAFSRWTVGCSFPFCVQLSKNYVDPTTLRKVTRYETFASGMIFISVSCFSVCELGIRFMSVRPHWRYTLLLRIPVIYILVTFLFYLYPQSKANFVFT